MPTIQVPLQSWTDIPQLKKSKRFKQLADEALALKREEDLIKARRSELSLELFSILDDVLDDQTKSIEFDGAIITKKLGGKSPRFDKRLLMETPIPCANPKCKTDNHVTADIIDACMKYGERRPSVSINLPGEKDNEE